MSPSEQDIRNRLLVARLPVLPHILLKLIEYCRNEEVGMAELAELISKDTAIATKILGVASSSAYHRGGTQTVRLEQSLMSLGTDLIRTLVISESIFQTFNGFSTSSSVNLGDFWKHSLTTAVLAREVARKMGFANIDEAYLAGLLHDVGRLAFLAISPNDYAQHFGKFDDESLCEEELKSMQMTHSDAGAWMIERWKLDPTLADAVLYHHEQAAQLEGTHPICRIVFVAHRMAQYPCDSHEVREAAVLCDMQVEELEEITRNAEARVEESAKFLGIDLSSAKSLPSHPPHAEASDVHKSLHQELHQVLQTSEAAKSFSRQTSEPKLLETIRQSVRILFKLRDAMVLTLDAPNRTLVGNKPGNGSSQTPDISLPLMRGGAAAEAALQRRATFVQGSDTIHATEAPLLRALNAEELLCMPLMTNGQCLGVLVCGLSPLKTALIREQMRFLQSFAAESAAALLALRQKQEEARNIAASATEEFRLSSRKIVHEVNNPLAIIKNYLNLLNDKLALQGAANGEISILHAEIDRVGQLVRQFAEPQAHAKSASINLNRVVNDVLRIFRDTGFAPKSINLVAETADAPAEIECEEGALRQILMNLLKNAVEAMPEGGDISIVNKGRINHNGQLYLELSVQDTGPGIRKEILERLFSPGQSTKGASHRGLGLSIVHDLVKKSDGFISCRSDHRGTQFVILLPVRNAHEGAS